MASRTFFSVASDSTNAPGDVDGATAGAGSPPSAEVEEAASKLNLEYYPDRKEVDLGLAELFRLVGNGPGHERAWHFYQNLQNLSQDLTSDQRDQMIRFLGEDPTLLSSERIIFLVEKIALSERNEFHHESAIKAALNRDSLATAMDYHRKSLDQSIYASGASLILRHTIEHEEWYKAMETVTDYFFEYCRHNEIEVHYETMWEDIDRSLIWHHVYQLPFSILSQKAAAVAAFAAHATELATELATEPTEPATEPAIEPATEPATEPAIEPAIKPAIEPTIEPGAAAQRFALEVIIAAFSVQLHNFDDVDVPLDDARLAANLKVHEELFGEQERLTQGLKTQMTLMHNRAIAQLLVDKIGKYRATAFRYYQNMRRKELVPNREALEFLLRGFASAAESVGIFAVIDDFRNYHIKIPMALLPRIIQALANVGELESVHEFFREYLDRGGKPSEFVFKALLHVHVRRAEAHHVVEQFHDLPLKYGFVQTAATYAQVIQAYARVGVVEEAVAWFDRMVEAGHKPEGTTYYHMIQMYAKRGDSEAVQRLFRESQAAGLESPMNIVNSVVLALVRNDRLEEARKLCEEALDLKLKYPPTRMWNYLLAAYAHTGSVEHVREIHSRMREAGVPANAETYSALLRSLTHRRLPNHARVLMFRVLPRVGIAPVSIHYAIIMNGYLMRGDYSMVLRVYKDMLSKRVAPTQGAQALLLQAVAAIEKLHTSSSEQPSELARTLLLFKQIVTNMNTKELARPGVIPALGADKLDETFPSINFRVLLSLYGRAGAFDKVRELYHEYLAKVKESKGTGDFIPPIGLLSALLAANDEARDFGEVDRCWHLGLEKFKQLADPSDIGDDEPWRPLYSRRFLLNQPLLIYLISLETQDRIDDVTATVESLLDQGAELYNTAWNMYVQILARNGRERLAFSICERELMEEWYGWESMGNRLSVKRRFENIKPDGIRVTKRFPHYETVAYLAAAFIKTRSRDPTVVPALMKIAPRVVNMVVNMPKADDSVQSSILVKDEDSYV